MLLSIAGYLMSFFQREAHCPSISLSYLGISMGPTWPQHNRTQPVPTSESLPWLEKMLSSESGFFITRSSQQGHPHRFQEGSTVPCFHTPPPIFNQFFPHCLSPCIQPDPSCSSVNLPLVHSQNIFYFPFSWKSLNSPRALLFTYPLLVCGLLLGHHLLKRY